MSYPVSPVRSLNAGVISLCFVALLLAACGGGEVHEPEPPPVTELYSSYAHTCFDGTYVVSQDSLKDALEQCPVPQTCDLEKAREISDSEIWNFLKVVDPNFGHTVRWAEAPEIRLADNLTDRQHGIILEAVSRLNEALPQHYELEVGRDVEPLTDVVPDGNIYVDFANPSEWKNEDGEPVRGNVSSYRGIAMFRDNKSDPLGVRRAARFWIAPEAVSNSICPATNEDGRLLWVVTHELLHVLGFWWHPPGNYLPVSILPVSGCIKRITIPGPLDCAALRKLYELEPGTPLDDID